MTSTGHRIRCTVAPGTSTGRRKGRKAVKKGRRGPSQQAVDNEVSALAMLTFYESLLIEQELSVRIKRVQFRENARAFPRDKENCIQQRGVHICKGGFDCTFILTRLVETFILITLFKPLHGKQSSMPSSLKEFFLYVSLEVN